MTTECKSHKAIETHDRCYAGGNVEDCPAAAGGITRIEMCSCGASRDCHINGRFSTEWSPWSDSAIDWWVRRNGYWIWAACSDPELADEWTRLVASSTNHRDLEKIREAVRGGKQITLYERAGTNS